MVCTCIGVELNRCFSYVLLFARITSCYCFLCLQCFYITQLMTYNGYTKSLKVAFHSLVLIDFF